MLDENEDLEQKAKKSRYCCSVLPLVFLYPCSNGSVENEANVEAEVADDALELLDLLLQPVDDGNVQLGLGHRDDPRLLFRV